MKRVATLKGAYLAYWVAKALRKSPAVATENVRGRWHCIVSGQTYQPASDPGLILALLDGERITLDRDVKGQRWIALHPGDHMQIGGQAPDLATAVLRAFLVGVYGECVPLGVE